MTGEDIKTVRLVINSEQATKKLEEINAKLETARQKKQAAFERGDAKGLQVYTKEVRRLEREQRNLQTRSEGVAKVLKNLDRATPKELRRTIKEINKELNSGAVERGSKEWQTLTGALQQCNAELRAINEEQSAFNESESGLAAFGKKWFGFTTIVSQAYGAIDGAISKMSGAVDAFAQMEEAEADVRKYTGLTTEQVKELNEEFKQMDTRTSREQLNALAADAGRLGIQGKEEVLEFVDAANVINVALGEDLGEGAVKQIGKLAQLFGDSDRMGLRGAMLATASTINDLGQSSSASEGYIVDFTGRLAGAGQQAGMTQAQIMAIGSVLDQSMVTAEEGSTALSKIIQKIYREPQKMAQAAGLDVQRFTELVKTDANAALLEFAQAVSQMGGMERIAPMLGDLSMTGAGVSKTLMALAGNIDLVRQTQDQATQSFADATSAQREYDTANNTTQAQLEKAKKRFEDLRIELGEQLLPVMSALMGTMRGIISVISSLISFTIKHKGAIAAAAVTIAAYTAVLKAQVVWHGLCTAATKAHTVVQTAWNVVVQAGALLAGSFRAAVGLLHVAFIAMTKGTTAATVAWRALNIAIKASPIGLVLSAIIAVVSGLVLWASKTNELTAAEKAAAETRRELSEVQKTAAESTNDEKRRIEMLTAIVRDNSKSIRDRRAAINELRKIIPNYHAEINNEGKIIRENKKAIDEYIANIDRMALAEAMYEKLKKNAAEQADAELAVRAWERAVLYREKQMKLPGHEKKVEIINGDPQSSFSIAVEKPSMNTEAQDQQRTYKERLEFWKKRREELKQQREAYNAYIKEKNLQTDIDKITISGSTTTTIPTTTLTGGTGSTGGTGGGTGGGNTTTDPLAKLKEMAEVERNIAYLRRQTGLTTEAQYREELLAAETAYYTAAKALYAEGSNERVALEKEEHDKLRRINSDFTAWSAKQIDIEEKAAERTAQQQYAEGTLSEEQYQQRLTDIKREALSRRVQLEQQFGTEESRAAAEAALADHDTAQQLNKREAWMKALNDLRRQYTADEKADDEKILEELYKNKIIKEEEYQELLKKIREKKGGEEKTAALEIGGSTDALTASFLNLITLFDQLNNRIKEGSATWTDYAAVAVAAIGMVSSIASAASSYYQAEQRAEEARVTARYDAEIKKAGESSKRGKKLEEKKQKELARIKTEYAERGMAMEMAGAVAQTAVAAINAYASASKVSFILGPIAASAALAAGALQIATIKKQHEAQAAGYYDGGFTGGNRYRREAGVVHEGEFVANHLAVQNPALSPVLRLIDHAQRTNRVASLTAADVSAAVAAPLATAQAAAAPIIVHETAATTEALQRLNERLEAPIETYVVLDGPDGLDSRYRRYNKLKGRST